MLYEQEEALIANIIQKDTARTYLSSESGFWYFYEIKDTTNAASPKFGDKVIFTYDIKRFNGETVLSASENGTQNYFVDQTNQDLISGIRDGIKLMKAGETVTFLFPSYKAYGYYGIENKLGTNIPVQSTITLQSIQPQDN